jgi:hypothetical protein
MFARRPDAPPHDKALQNRMFASLDRIDYSQLDFQEKLDLIRSYGLIMTRLGPPEPAMRDRLIAKFDPLLPSDQRELNWELADMLAYLDAPSTPAKLMALLRTAPAAGPYFGYKEWINPQLRVRNNPGRTGPAGSSNASLARQQDQIYFAQLLRTVKNGWTMPLREEYMKWFVTELPEYKGGNEFVSAKQSIRMDAIAMLPEDAKAALKSIIDTPYVGTRGGNFQQGGGAAAAAAAAAAAGRGGATPAAGRGGQ